MGPQQEKAALRERYRRERKEAFVSRDFLHILTAPEFSTSHLIASYIATEFEPQTQLLNQELLRRGKRLLLPRVASTKNGKNSEGAMSWVEWNGQMEHLKKNKNLLEPIGDVWEEVSKIEVVITPALRVDGEGFRLGQGGGFYDRALAHISGWKIALVHSGELSSAPLPRESHDQKVNAAATPDLLVRFR